MKIAPIYRASLAHSDITCKIIHTGQHYDHQMSHGFFEELGIPAPTHFLECGSGSHAVQTARIMVSFEQVCLEDRPDLVLVVGDVNSTLACSIVAKKLQIAVAHVEAGLRSFDLSMPEEINRMVTDAISDWFFVTEESGATNLKAEGKASDRIHTVGHVMVDNLLHQHKQLSGEDASHFDTFELKNRVNDYLFLTLHRPSNVDCSDTFTEIASAVNELALEQQVFFPVHPRTRQMIDDFGISFSDRVHLLPPLGFRESLFLWKDAHAVLTDSGGLQEETTALGVPCVTIRDNTERPITVTEGTNVLAGTSRGGIISAYGQSLTKREHATIPTLWDGKASERIWQILARN
jgi:UDP-N-acetylglucosamine 2-epimerase (non-hydrolysing)